MGQNMPRWLAGAGGMQCNSVADGLIFEKHRKKKKNYAVPVALFEAVRKGVFGTWLGVGGCGAAYPVAICTAGCHDPTRGFISPASVALFFLFRVSRGASLLASLLP